jgi:hypothetical protein
MKMEAESNQHPLATPNEVRRGSGDRMFAFFGNHPVITVDKIQYYIMKAIEGRYDENPYYKD